MTPKQEYAHISSMEVHELEAGEIEAQDAPQRFGIRGRRALKLIGLACAGAAAVGLASSLRGSAGHAQRADVEATQQKTLGEAVGDIQDAVSAGKEVFDAANEALPDLQKGYKAMGEAPDKLRDHLENMDWQDPSHVADLMKFAELQKNVTALLKPTGQDRHDGNVCPDDEEAHAGLCYKKCSALTNGVYKIRTSAWSCCHEEPCSFFNSKTVGEPFPCNGFDVAGKKEGQGCPHQPGSCMPNEEFSLGVCYKKCAILTENEYTFRSGAATCCKYNSHLACIDAANVKSSPMFNVGGGLGDDSSATPAESHGPMAALTEAAEATA